MRQGSGQFEPFARVMDNMNGSLMNGSLTGRRLGQPSVFLAALPWLTLLSHLLIATVCLGAEPQLTDQSVADKIDDEGGATMVDNDLRVDY